MNGRAKQSKQHKKKRKRGDGEELEKPKETPPTVSIAVSGSIIDNAQSVDLATLLAGQIARAATIFRIDEVVVFDNKVTSSDVSEEMRMNDGDENERGAPFLVRILRYLETPQYLRKHLFPIHKNLKWVGLLPPLDAPHHLRKHEWSSFREGVTLERSSSNTTGTLVDVGLSKSVLVEQVLEPGIRVTVAMGTNRSLGTGTIGHISNPDCMRKVVSSMSPRDEGLYWGYKVRYASNISSVFKNCPFKGGYDHIIGTSEHGLKIKSSELVIPEYRHLLIAFGGLGGLEESIEEDGEMKGKHVNDVFSSYLNTCPLQGSRTIRTEEAVFISLQYFQEAINKTEEKI